MGLAGGLGLSGSRWGVGVDVVGLGAYALRVGVGSGVGGRIYLQAGAPAVGTYARRPRPYGVLR